MKLPNDKDVVPVSLTRSESDLDSENAVFLAEKDPDGKGSSCLAVWIQKLKRNSCRGLMIVVLALVGLTAIVAGIVAGLDVSQRQNNASGMNLLKPGDWPELRISSTDSPSASPTAPTSSPSSAPTAAPSASPSASPSAAPSASPSASPSAAPTASPSAAPSASPSASPSAAPTASPSASPTFAPTGSPTQFPTPEVVYIPPNPVPLNPPSGYFNYDPDSPYGPNNWHRVNTNNHWIREFGSNGFGPWDGHFNTDLTRNACGDRARKQSPKNLVKSEECEAHHEIRTECATDPLSDDDAFEKLILPHKLSIVSQRRPCTDPIRDDGRGDGRCEGSLRPPMVDYPKYASNGSAYSDMHHLDIKIPGEHTLEGVRFDAEIQMFHTHHTIDRISSIAVPVRGVPGVYNEEFQWILNEFQNIYDRHQGECDASRRNLRQQKEPLQQQLQPEPASVTNSMVTHSRELQFNNPPNIHRQKFNPYSDALMPGMFFYRYDGSITEPPCRELTWWVMDEPAIIGLGQLNQLKTLLFTHVDSDCNPTSVHNQDQMSVRPIQPLGEDRVIQHCPAGSFKSDIAKGRKPAKRCRA